VSFQQEYIVFSIITSKNDFSWPLFACNNLNYGIKTLNFYITPIYSVRSTRYLDAIPMWCRCDPRPCASHVPVTAGRARCTCDIVGVMASWWERQMSLLLLTAQADESAAADTAQARQSPRLEASHWDHTGEHRLPWGTQHRGSMPGLLAPLPLRRRIGRVAWGITRRVCWEVPKRRAGQEVEA